MRPKFLTQAASIGLTQKRVFGQAGGELSFGQPQERNCAERQSARLDDVGDKDFVAIRVERWPVGCGIDRAGKVGEKGGKIG